MLVLAGIVQGSSGFGFSLVAVGLLGMVLGDPKMGTIIPVFANTVLTAYMMWRYVKHVQFRSVIPFLAGSLSGVPLGVWALSKVSAVWINLGLAVVLIFSGIYAMLPQHRRRDWHAVWLGLPCGLMSGSLAGAFNTGGPPAVAYLSNRSLGRYEFVATLQFVFLMAGIVRIVFLGGFGMFDRQILFIGALGILTAMLGCVIGNWILHRLSDKHLKTYVCVFQIALGVIYVWRTLG